jgi:hypothetical protein
VVAVDQDEALLDPAFFQTVPHLRGDVHEPAPAGEVEPQFFAIGFHNTLLGGILLASEILLDSPILR